MPVNLSNIYLAPVMVGMEIGLDVNTLPIAAIGIGVGIDYGIYLLSRICEEYGDGKHYGEAIGMAVATTGKAIFFTATIVLLSILPWYKRRLRNGGQRPGTVRAVSKRVRAAASRGLIVCTASSLST